MRRLSLAAILAITLAVTASPVRAGGAYFSRDAESAPTSRAEQACLMWFDGWETLCLQSDYRGPLEDFVWIIPVSSEPEVSLADPAVLAAMEAKTRPQVALESGRKLPAGCAGGPAPQKPLELAVTVLQSMKLDKLDVRVLRARPSAGGQDLLAWLQAEGYHVPLTAAPVLQRYIDDGFCFVAVKFARDAYWKGAPAGLRTGESPGTMIQLRFKTDRPFFPLAVSAVNAAADEDILLFTVAEHRLAPVAQASVELRNLADLGSLAAIQDGSAPEARLRQEIQRQLPGGFVVEAAVSTPCEIDQDGRASMAGLATKEWGRHVKNARLTRFHGVLRAGQMTSDLHFAPAASDSPDDGVVRIKLSATGSGGVPAPALALAALVVPLGWRRAGRRARPFLLAAALVLVALA